MLVTETKTVTRELYVAPCLKCGNKEIALSDCNYSSFNKGGGDCKRCKHQIYATCGCLPTNDELAKIWNSQNDIETLLNRERKKIAKAEAFIKTLLEKQETIGA